ncbi:hypothetical protein N9T35_00245 [bacterium]|nr:hypothetical protein [bacterium]
MSQNNTSQDWKLSVDLLIARAALDPKLAQELLNDSGQCFAKNGIEIPQNVQLVIASETQDVVVKTIPTFCQSDVKVSVDELPQMVGSSTFNSSGTNTSTAAEQTTAAVSTAVEAAEAATTVVVEAEVALVLT